MVDAVSHFKGNLAAGYSGSYVLWGLVLEASLPVRGTAERDPQGRADSSGMFVRVLTLPGHPPVACCGFDMGPLHCGAGALYWSEPLTILLSP